MAVGILWPNGEPLSGAQLGKNAGVRIVSKCPPSRPDMRTVKSFPTTEVDLSILPFLVRYCSFRNRTYFLDLPSPIKLFFHEGIELS